MITCTHNSCAIGINYVPQVRPKKRLNVRFHSSLRLLGDSSSPMSFKLRLSSLSSILRLLWEIIPNWSSPSLLTFLTSVYCFQPSVNIRLSSGDLGFKQQVWESFKPVFRFGTLNGQCVTLWALVQRLPFFENVRLTTATNDIFGKPIKHPVGIPTCMTVNIWPVTHWDVPVAPLLLPGNS